jgi:hypothetical protein
MKEKITYSQFVNTGRFINWKEFTNNITGKKPLLHNDCTQVVSYMNDFIIQVLKTNEFYVKIGTREIRHKNLDVVESALWYLKAEKVINTLK